MALTEGSSDAVRVLEKAVELEPNNPIFTEYLTMAKA